MKTTISKNFRLRLWLFIIFFSILLLLFNISVVIADDMLFTESNSGNTEHYFTYIDPF